MTESSHDWDAIEREYRVGQLSNRELARVHGVSEAAIRKRAKGDEKRPRWIRDLAPLVRAETERRLMEGSATPKADEAPANARPPTVRAIVDAAALRGAEIVLAHRTHILGLRTRMDELATFYDGLAGRLQNAPFEGELKDHRSAFTTMANGLEQLLGVSATLIGLERQAFSLDRPDPGEGGGGAITPDQRATALRNLRARMAAETTT